MLKIIYIIYLYSLNINVGRTPLERKYQNSFLCIQQLITAPEITHLKIMIMILMISKVNSKIIFQSFFIKSHVKLIEIF